MGELKTFSFMVLFVGCSAVTPNVKTNAECAAIRTFYEDAQSKLIDSGACDSSTSISSCVPHVALREAFIASLKENKCPSEKK